MVTLWKPPVERNKVMYWDQPFRTEWQPVIQRLRELNLELDIWSLDDGILVGIIDAIKVALSIPDIL